jgi:transcriptional regulator with GAF, ATPase, and Fis domain
LDNREREFVLLALKQADGRHDKAATLLRITPRQLRHLLDKHDLRRHRLAPDDTEADGSD